MSDKHSKRDVLASCMMLLAHRLLINSRKMHAYYSLSKLLLQERLGVTLEKEVGYILIPSEPDVISVS
jgi:hypothetical protein